MSPYSRLLVLSGMLILQQSTGCSIKATIDQTTDTTSNVTGTTSSARSWQSADGQVRPSMKATAFVSFNHHNLLQDLAAGRGEYLRSMAVLLAIPHDRQEAFFAAVQADYARTAGTDSQEPEVLLAWLQTEATAFLR